MTGLPDDNRKAFREAAALLRSMGFDVCSPDELDDIHPAKERTWAGYLMRDIPYLLQCEMGIALPGWRNSKGATLEAAILNALGRPVAELIDGSLRPVPPEMLPQIVHPVPLLEVSTNRPLTAQGERGNDG